MLFLQKQPQQFARRNDLSVKKYCQEKTPTSHFERWLCSDTQKAASVSKVRAFQETGSTLPSALSLFISLPFPHLSLSLSVPGNPCVWADVQSHHEHCGGPSLLSSSAPYCPRFPFVLLISFFFFFLPSDITKWTAELKGSIASLQKKTSIWQQRVMLL